MQILTNFIVNILVLKMHPKKMNKKKLECMPPVPPAATHLCGLGNYSFPTSMSLFGFLKCWQVCSDWVSILTLCLNYDYHIR